MSTITPDTRTLQGRKVLLIEENDQLHRALADALADAGAIVLGGVSCAPKGAGLLPLSQVDVAIVDASRPSGTIDLIQELQRSSIPCLIISPEPLRCLRPANARYLSKPFTEQQLLAAVCSVVRWHEYAEVVSQAVSHSTHRQTPPRPLGSLRDRSVLLIEDDYLVAMDMWHALQHAGATVVGPAASVEEALKLVEDEADIDIAVVDIRLRDADAFPVAEALEDRNIPFVFATGYDRNVVPPRFTHVPWCRKPLDLRVLAKVLTPAAG